MHIFFYENRMSRSALYLSDGAVPCMYPPSSPLTLQNTKFCHAYRGRSEFPPACLYSCFDGNENYCQI